MENEDIEKLCDEEATYRSWLREESFKRNKHICFYVPASEDFEDKLMQAVMRGCTECLDKLIKAGADVNKTGEYRITALMWASRYGHPDCVNLLLATRADLYMTDKFGNTALSHAVDGIKPRGQQITCLFIILKAIGNNLNSSPLATETPLMSIADCGENTWLKSLIEAGADVNRTDMFGRTALMRIVTTSDDCTQTLLRAGADVNIVDKFKCTALKYATSMICRDGIKCLLEAGAEVKDDVNSTYINEAVECGFSSLKDHLKMYRCIQLLLKNGAYINQSRGKNALEVVINDGFTGPVQELLLAAGNTINERYKSLIWSWHLISDEEEFSLKHLSREAVRKQMITAHPHDNLFQTVPKLGIPSILESYLVYDISVNDDDYSDKEFLDKWRFLFGNDDYTDADYEDSSEEEDWDDELYEDDDDDNSDDDDDDDDEQVEEDEDVNEMVGTDMVVQAGNNTLVPKKDVAVQTDFSMLLKMILEKLRKEDDSEVVVKEDGDKKLVVIYNKPVVNEDEDKQVVVNEKREKQK